MNFQVCVQVQLQLKRDSSPLQSPESRLLLLRQCIRLPGKTRVSNTNGVDHAVLCKLAGLQTLNFICTHW